MVEHKIQVSLQKDFLMESKNGMLLGKGTVCLLQQDVIRHESYEDFILKAGSPVVVSGMSEDKQFLIIRNHVGETWQLDADKADKYLYKLERGEASALLTKKAWRRYRTHCYADGIRCLGETFILSLIFVTLSLCWDSLQGILKGITAAIIAFLVLHLTIEIIVNLWSMSSPMSTGEEEFFKHYTQSSEELSMIMDEQKLS